MRVYVDVNVFIDYFQDNPNRPLKEFSFNFFREGWNCHFHLVISDWLRKEVFKKIREQDFELILCDFRSKGKLHFVKQESLDWKSAKKYAHPDDALHALLAKKGGADFLVTRNIRDYDDIDFIPVVFPEMVY